MLSNLPPGVTDAMIDEAFATACDECVECPYGGDAEECRIDRQAAEADARYDAMKEDGLR